MSLYSYGQALLALVAIAVTPVLAQHPASTRSVNDTRTNQPEHYAELVARFRSEPVSLGSIVMLGNSITESGNWRALFDDDSVLNRGISGDNTFGVLDRLDEIVRHRPRKIFLMIGINDISRDIPDEVIAYNVREIIQKFQEATPKTEIYLQSLLPIRPDYPGFLQHFAKENHVIHTNRLLREVAMEVKCRFINLFPVFMDSQERMDDRFTYDGLHLNETGYEVWAAYLREQRYLE